ncbi:FAD-binding domain-containing protein [Crassisporium funariophilum]|nr:FAD-binding domain-containing protein [Crassisporium funariophilum]
MFGPFSASFLFLRLFGELSSATAVSSKDWQALNTSVSGRLHTGVPFSQPCFSVVAGGAKNVPNPAQCGAVQANNADHLFRSENFGAFELTQWETCQTTGDECLVDWTNPQNPAAFAPPRQCSQGSVSSFYIDVKGADDVRAAYAFTRKTKVPLVIKNTGHDYLGRSAGPGTLALWTHNLDTLTISKTFVPDGCSSKPTTAITIGAGQQFRAIYDFAKANNVTFVGGADPSVGASGGWVMGGGHSAMSPSLGLGVDRVLQFKIVTPDGQLRTVNKCQNPDLWFALRGGGGGVFGVVLETSHIASPQVPVQAVLGFYDGSKASSTKLLKALAAGAVQFAADGWGGYITPPTASAVWGNPKLDAAAAQKSAAFIVEAFAAVGGNTTFFTLPSYTDWFDTFIAPNTDPVGRPQVLATRLIPADNFDDEKLIDAMINAMLESDFGQILAVTPFAFKGFDTGTAINPAWRTSVWHGLMSNFWNFNSTLPERVAQYQKLTTLWTPVRQLTPNGGAYYNEADVFEPNFQTTFWGPNYPRLLAIKNKYDPDHILDCWRCVGWKGPQDPKFKCYPNVN